MYLISVTILPLPFLEGRDKGVRPKPEEFTAALLQSLIDRSDMGMRQQSGVTEEFERPDRTPTFTQYGPFHQYKSREIGRAHV